MTTTHIPVLGPGTYTDPAKGYSVEIAKDGKVWVKKDDWLSKYSWAMYGNYDGVEEFARPTPSVSFPNQLVEGIDTIDDVDLIKTGECLVHVPTYKHWLDLRDIPYEPTPGPPIKKPVPSKPLPPGLVKSTNWTAANLGAIEPPIYVVGRAGVVLLAFHNLDVKTTFYHVLLRGGLGVGVDIGHALNKLKRAIRALGFALFAGRMATATFVPVNAYLPFSAKSVEGLDMRCLSWNWSKGPRSRSYDQIVGHTTRFEYFKVVFDETQWAIPGAGGGFTVGKLLWVW